MEEEVKLLEYRENPFISRRSRQSFETLWTREEMNIINKIRSDLIQKIEDDRRVNGVD